MIDATECRELAAESRQTADRAQTIRVRSILIDIARTWDRLALEVEHGTQGSPPSKCCDILGPSVLTLTPNVFRR